MVGSRTGEGLGRLSGASATPQAAAACGVALRPAMIAPVPSPREPRHATRPLLDQLRRPVGPGGARPAGVRSPGRGTRVRRRHARRQAAAPVAARLRRRTRVAALRRRLEDRRRSSVPWSRRTPTSRRRPRPRCRSCEMQIAYVESLCRIGAALGASVVRVFTAYESPGQSPHAAWQRVVTTRPRDVRPGRDIRHDRRDPEPPRRRRCTPTPCWNCFTTSTGRTANSGSMRGRRHCGAKTCTRRRRRRPRTRPSPRTPTTSACRATATGRSW